MRYAHFGNMANDGYSVVKALRDRNVNCDLYIGHPQHICAYPQWELCNLGLDEVGDVYHPNLIEISKNFQQPEWLHWLSWGLKEKYHPLKLLSLLPMFPSWKALRKHRYIIRELIWWTRFRRTYTRTIVEEMKKYDLLITHIPWYIYAQRTKKPYIVFDAGAIRCLWGYGKFSYQQMRMVLYEDAYRAAPLILVTNPDTLDLFYSHGFTDNQLQFMPFLIDTERYRPMEVENNLPYEYVIFHPSRQMWSEKGNWMAIQAFQHFQKEYPDSVLVLVDWSLDRKKTRELVKRLGLERHVKYLSLMSKPQLIEWYNKSTVVLDQFILGSYGTTAPEAMSCEAPVIMYLSKRHMLQTFGEMPPVLNVRSSEEIYKQLLLCTDKTFLRKQGELSRRWVLKHHGAEVVTQKHLEIYDKILQ